MSAARLVRGLGTIVVSQEIWMFKPTKGPEQSRKIEKYRAPTLSVEIMMTAPTKDQRDGDGADDVPTVLKHSLSQKRV